MELGATVCTPKTPQCGKCPVSRHCGAFQQVQITKSENKSLLANVKIEEPVDIEDIVEGNSERKVVFLCDTP